MSDIVERLRRLSGYNVELGQQAANEIERLRGELHRSRALDETWAERSLHDLRTIRAATIEQCAQVCHDLILDQKKPDPETIRAAIGAAIRALKERP